MLNPVKHWAHETNNKCSKKPIMIRRYELPYSLRSYHYRILRL